MPNPITVVPSPTIIIGPEDAPRAEQAQLGRAPRLDYRLVAAACAGSIRQCAPSPAVLRGPKAVRVGRSFLSNTGRSLRLVRSLGPGAVVYSTGETWGLPLGLVGGLLRQGFVHVMYAHRLYSPLWQRVLHHLRSLLRVDGWICVTHYQAHLLQAALGHAAAEVAVISQGVDTEFYDLARANPATRDPYVLSVGTEMRNYRLLFQAVREIDAPVIVKASSAWMAAPRAAIGDTPSNVTLLREHLSYTDLRDLYAGASVVVLPLHNTPQAAGITTMLEAMAMGKPVIATRSKGLRKDLIANGLSVVDPSPQRIADRVAELLDDPQRASMLAARGQAYVRENLTLEAHAGSVVSFINALSSRDRPYLGQADGGCQGDR